MAVMGTTTRIRTSLVLHLNRKENTGGRIKPSVHQCVGGCAGFRVKSSSHTQPVPTVYIHIWAAIFRITWTQCGEWNKKASAARNHRTTKAKRKCEEKNTKKRNFFNKFPSTAAAASELPFWKGFFGRWGGSQWACPRQDTGSTTQSMTANWKAEPAVHLCKIRNNCTHANTEGNVNTRRRLPSVPTLKKKASRLCKLPGLPKS